MGIDFQRGETRLFLGLYEMELNRHLRAIARRGHRSFDIGGHFGYDALLLAKLTGGPVVSVECDADLATEIRGNAAINPELPDITVETSMVTAEDGDGCVTIDALARRYFTPDLLKLDIEGGEVDALRGASRVLRDRKPAILLEVHGEEQEWECLVLLRAAGYRPPTTIDRRRWLSEHRPLAHNRWLVLPGT